MGYEKLIQTINSDKQLNFKQAVGTVSLKEDLNAFEDYLLNNGGLGLGSGTFLSPKIIGGWYNECIKCISLEMNISDSVCKRSLEHIFRNATNIFDTCYNKKATRDILDGNGSGDISEQNLSYYKDFKKMYSELKADEIDLNLYYYDELFIIVGYSKNKHRYLMPKNCFDLSMNKDYSDIKICEVGKLLCGDSNTDGKNGIVIVNSLDNSSLSSLNAKKNDYNKKVEDLNATLHEIRNNQTEELKKMQDEIDKLKQELESKKSNLMAELNRKKAELQEKIDEVERVVFMLETQIYGIRCYLGEVIKFKTIETCGVDNITSGDDKLVIYQKIRYLDEELGRALSLYSFSNDDIYKETFLSILRNRADIRDIFLPNRRCITFLKMSKTGNIHVDSTKTANALTSYEVYHGTQLAILIRTGNKIHISWLDDDKISISSDDNVFYRAGESISTPYDESDQIKHTDKETIISRYFIVSILQGIMDHNPELVGMSKDKSVNLFKNNSSQDEIIWSLADGWITSSKYGSFEEMLKRVKSKPLRVGSKVIPVMTITRDDVYSTLSSGRSSKYERYNNDRGIGDRNRTYDAYIDKCEIYDINKITYSLKISYSYRKVFPDGSESSLIESTVTLPYDSLEYIKNNNINRGNSKVEFYPSKFSDLVNVLNCYSKIENCSYYETDNGDEKNISWYTENAIASGQAETDKVIYKKKIESASSEKVNAKYYISAKRSEHDSRSNLEVLRSELIEIDFLSCDWIEEVITTGNVGRWYYGGSMSFGESLKYLNLILQFLRERKEEYKKSLIEAGLSSLVESKSNWESIIAEWKLSQSIYNFNDSQARKVYKLLN